MGKTILVAARKGGVGKTTTSLNLGIGLARKGKKVLLIDADSQNSLTSGLGIREPEKLTVTLSTVISEIIGEREINTMAGIIPHLRVLIEKLTIIPPHDNSKTNHGVFVIQ